MLKKEFTKRDVTRIRNIVKGKADEKTTTSVGYTKKVQFHEEGDVWEENGKTWTIENNIKQSLRKADKIKNSLSIPYFCPECKHIMNNRHDKDYYIIHTKCYDCVIDMEHDLKSKGEWEKYQIKIHNNEIDNKIKDFKVYMLEKLNQQNDSFVSEDGDVERWVGKIDKDKVDLYIKEVEEYLTNLKK